RRRNRAYRSPASAPAPWEARIFAERTWAGRTWTGSAGQPSAADASFNISSKVGYSRDPRKSRKGGFENRMDRERAAEKERNLLAGFVRKAVTIGRRNFHNPVVRIDGPELERAVFETDLPFVYDLGGGVGWRENFDDHIWRAEEIVAYGIPPGFRDI